MAAVLAAACAMGLAGRAAAEDSPPRAALIDLDRSLLAGLVEAELLAAADAEWLERSEMEKLLAERQLQSVLAADAARDRVTLGRTLKAEILVILQTKRKDEQQFAELVVAETGGGLRLVAESLPLGEDPEADAGAVVRLVARGLARHREQITHVVAAPPFVSHDLTYEHDHLRQAYARLVEQTLLEQPGVVMVELAEAQALAREFELADADGRIHRRLPLYVLGDYRHQGQGDSRSVSIVLRVQQGSRLLNRLRTTLAPDEAPDWLRRAALELIMTESAPAEVAAPQVEARQLAARAGNFLKLGNWQEALALLEASLLLEPDQPAVRGEAIRASGRLAGEFDRQQTEGLIRAFQLLSRGFEHLRELAAKEDLAHVGPHLNALGASGGFVRVLGVEGGDAELAQRVRRQHAEEIALALRLAHRYADQGQWPQSVFCLRRATGDLPPVRRYDETIKFILQYQSHPDAAAMTRAYAHHGYTVERVGSVEGRQFLEKLRNSPDANAQVRKTAEEMWEAIGNPQPAGVAVRSVSSIQNSPLTFEPLQLEYTDLDGRPQTLRWIEGCLPLGDRLDLLWNDGAVLALRPDGTLHMLWKPALPNTRLQPPSYDGRYVWISASVHEHAAEVWVLEPRQAQAWQISKEHGLPLLDPQDIGVERGMPVAAVAAGVGVGRAIVAGSIGRSWLAHVAFDPHGQHQIRIFHEAKEPPPRPGSGQLDSTNAQFAFVPAYVLPLSDRTTEKETPGKVLVGRGYPGLEAHPLVVDPADLSVRVMDEPWHRPDGVAGRDPRGDTGLAFHYAGVAAPRWDMIGLYRLGLPDLKPELLIPDIAEGHLVFEGDVVNVVGQQWWRGSLRGGQLRSFGEVPWVYHNTWGPSPQEITIAEKGSLSLRSLTYSSQLGLLVCCQQSSGGTTIARVKFDGSGLSMQEALNGPAPAAAAAAGASKPAPAMRLAPPRHEILWQTTGNYTALAWSPDGRWIVTTSRVADRAVQLWNAADGRLLADLLAHPAGMTRIAVSRSGKHFATGGHDGVVVLWSAADLRPVHRIAAHRNAVSHLAFSWDERWLASAGDDRRACVWDVASGEQDLQIENRHMGIQWIGFTPDGSRLLTTASGTADYWDRAGGEHLGRIESLAAVADFLPDRSLVGAAPGWQQSLIAWDCTSDTSRRLLEYSSGEPLAVSADGRRLATLQRDAFVDGQLQPVFRLQIWDLAEHRPILNYDCRDPLARFAFSPDGRFLLAAIGSSVRRWDLDAPPTAAAGPRTWTDSTGQHRTQATFVSVAQGLVSLQKSAGEIVRVPLDRLSAGDQEYIRQQVRSGGTR